jgi:hypothetical protein
MAAAAVLVLVLTGLSAERPLRPITVTDTQSGLKAYVLVLPPEQNRGFCIIDVPARKEGDNIRAHWRAEYELMFNGGFFDTTNFTPAAYCVINGVKMNPVINTRWSGMLAIDQDGAIHLLWRTNDVSGYHSVLQAGPYVIDPGGAIGIKSRSGPIGQRTLVGFTHKRELVIMVTESIHLYDLAYAVKRQMPQIERLLNLDGGPSSGFKCETLEILNEWPVRNYVAKKKQ